MHGETTWLKTDKSREDERELRDECLRLGFVKAFQTAESWSDCATCALTLFLVNRSEHPELRGRRIAALRPRFLDIMVH